jgi:TatD DNase family protein
MWEPVFRKNDAATNTSSARIRFPTAADRDDGSRLSRYRRGMFVDSHCHLNYKGLAEDQAGVLERARAAGVEAMLNISTRASEWDAVIAVAERESDVWASVGIHPHDADAHPDVETDTLVERAAHARVVGIGESGLDYYYDHSDRERQRASFRAHIAAARETGLPIIVHTRDAEEDTATILAEEMGKGAFPGVIHCFTASGDFARKALDLGLYISISGIVTFKNARDLQETARALPAERLLIETDSPFLAPVPHRGRPCEPAFVADTARFLADLRGEPVEALAERTSANFRALFAKAA